MHLAELLFIPAVFVSTFYWVILYGRLFFYRDNVRYDENGTISIVIAGKNEALKLADNLPLATNQIGINEVIFMNDYSSDDSSSVLNKLATTYQSLRVMTPSKNIPGKKLALSEGILSTTSQNILLTDADCKPISTEWATLMNAALNNDSRLVLGYGPLYKEKGLVNLFSRFETIITAIQYFAFALYGSPYMGVGRNLAFTKNLFTDLKGYTNQMHIPSGDDDLLVQEARHKTNIAINLDPKTFVYSKSKTSWQDYLKQKRRHMATSSSYSLLHKVLLSIHPLFHILSFALGILLLFSGYAYLVFVTLFIRWAILIILGFHSYSRLDGKDLLLFIPIFDLMLIPYYIFFSLFAFNSKPTPWN